MNRITLIIVCLFLCCQSGYTQKQSGAFARGEVPLFEDNFQSDSVGTFPKHWWIIDHDSTKYKKLCKVRYVDGRKALVIDSIQAEWLKQSLLGEPGPRMRSMHYLPNKFTLEYDFLMGTAGSMYLNFYATHAATIFMLSVLDNKHHNSGDTRLQYAIFEGPPDPPYVNVNIDPFKYNSWHHMAISYEIRRATIYLDGKKIFTTPAVDRDPLKFMLGYQPYDSIAYTNFRLATDSSTAEANFNLLFSESTFTTHAIHFETDKATIQAKSMVFMKRLAVWLKANPTIKLQINGHTDNEGDAAYNLKLSQERADAVKAMLVSFGVTEARLTTKGYGASKPIKENNTPEGKAENRRVEFIKK